MPKEDEMTEETAGGIITYEDIVQEVAEREVDPGEIESSRTLAEAEEETEHRTDLQAILRILTPTFPTKELNDVLQPAMVSRIFADNMLDKMKLLVLRQLQIHAPTERIDLIGIISMVQDALSIGFEGRGIIDRLEIAGVAHEEEMDKLAKELGMGG